MPRPAEWTEEEIWKLKHLYPSEKSFEEIAEVFPNRTANAIRLKASRLCLRRPTLPSSVCQSQTILLCSEGGNGCMGYLFRCVDCGSWTHVSSDGGEEIGNSKLVCSKCGSACYIVV